MADQWKRTYELTVGDYKTGQGIQITDLEITFDVSKSADNKRNANSAAIEIYNLSQTSLQLIETEYLTVALSVGYEGLGNKLLVSGNVTETSTRRNGVDRVTQLLIGEGYSDLNHSKLKGIVPAGKTVQDVIEEIRKSMPGVSRGVYTGTNLNNPIIYGYPLNSNPRISLNELCEAHRLEYRVDRGVLYVSDENGLISKDLSAVPSISPASGLIDTPFYASGETGKDKKDKTRRQGMQFKALLNPEIAPGGVVYVESSYSTGYYRVNSARYTGDFRGNDWYVECQCSNVLGDDLK